MLYVKISNLLNNGTANYKGLVLKNIQAGSQIYFLTNGKNEAYFAYNGDAVNHPDLEVITEEQYLLAKQEYEESISTETEPLEELRQENAELKLALAELAESHELEKTEMQLAIAELAELVGGEING